MAFRAFPARYVRLIKLFLIWIPIIIFIDVAVFTLYLLMDEALANSTATNVVKAREKWEDQIQRDSVCQRVIGNQSWVNTTTMDYCLFLQEQERRYYSLSPWIVNNFTYQYVIDGAQICDVTTDVIVLVHSLHSYEDRRTAIRSTWGQASVSHRWPTNATFTENVRLAFIFGTHQKAKYNEVVRNENAKYHDVIQGSFKESYKNMTLKSLLGLKWVKEHCPSAKILVKSDDDMFINMPYLLAVVRNTTFARSIMGPYNVGSKVSRVKKSKWYIPKSDFPFYYYPPYESGATYVISGDLVADLYHSSRFVPYIFIDDVYITGILARIIGAKHYVHGGFAYWTTKRPDVCAFIQNKMITSTKFTPEFLSKYWEQLRKGKKCS